MLKKRPKLNICSIVLLIALAKLADALNGTAKVADLANQDELTFGERNAMNESLHATGRNEANRGASLSSTTSSTTTTTHSSHNVSATHQHATTYQSLSKVHAMAFKSWLDSKSSELYELSMNYSGYKILTFTYNSKLRKDARFAWINFTSMIINISHTISQVLYNKTLLVKNLSELVEKSYDDYKENDTRILESTNFIYYDSKSPFTFCDVKETYFQKFNNKSKTNASMTTTTTTASSIAIINNSSSSSSSSTTTTTKVSTKSSHAAFKFKRELDNEYFVAGSNVDGFFEFQIFNSSNNDDTYTDYRSSGLFSPHRHRNPNRRQFSNSRTIQNEIVHINLKKNQANLPSNTPRSGLQPRGRNLYTRPTTTTTTTTTTPIPTTYSPSDNDENDEDDTEDTDEMDSSKLNVEEGGEFWNITCINRTYDENFKSVQKVNRNQSTIQVPINVFKQELAMNMTAYWTKALDEQFKKNYDLDNELFWQYFCSSQGLFRRYPAAYWSVPQDFFDCRLLSWYVMAAASSKDAIILLDTSGSMTGLRLEIAKRLIVFMLDTFSDNDFFNIMTFSNTVSLLHYLKD
jgi:hypothetical protein